MIQPRSVTRFGGSHSLHSVAIASPARRARPTLSTVHLTSNEAAAVLAFLDGLALVCSATSAAGALPDPNGFDATPQRLKKDARGRVVVYVGLAAARAKAEEVTLENPSTVDMSRAEAMFTAMVGAYVWWSRTGEDAILRMDFGTPRLRVREPSPNADRHVGEVRAVLARRLVIPTGRWHLFIEGGDWTVEVEGLSCGRRDAEDAEKTRHVVKCLSRLDGQKLIDVERSMDGGLWLFKFDLGGLVSIGNEPQAGPTGAAWTIFGNDGSSLSWMLDFSFVLGEGTSRG